ncbi:DEP domain-containing protein 4 isoform X2 [Nerophis lumbriciformis]|uniref:DEP domain-containing protein 4 isoform X2 n=1 Tax=Nerophis lumbriciformis TaxID=546530 RepID=UPI002AE092AF|nr:DEP domain-containing protein 7-like isoform X2 [Nerophis lumbriciformis]
MLSSTYVTSRGSNAFKRSPEKDDEEKGSDVTYLGKMAVDLTPRFRRLNSKTRSFRESLRYNGLSGPFGATQLWHNIIQALHSQVEVRRRRRHLRTHTNSFTGSDAVDAVLSYLMQNTNIYATDVSRLKAARLCQALMEAKVFEPVGAKLFRRDKDEAFEDNSGSLYRFLDSKSDMTQIGSKDVENQRKDFGMKKSKRAKLNDMLTISNPLAVGPSDKKVETLLRSFNLPPSAATASTFLPKTAVEEVWKQQTLLQLLQIVELPMLDCILASPARSGRVPLANQDLVIPNTYLERELPDTLHLPHWDGWLSAAVDCLELFPDQLIVVAGEQLQWQDGAEQPASQNRVLFDIIAKYYSGREKAPILSGRYLDVHVAILKLLEEAKVHDAIKASQLCLRLLQTSSRDELRRLLAFMAAAARPHACRLQKQRDNRTVISRTFLKAIVHNAELTKSQSETLVLFLMDNHKDLFKTPTSLIEAVRRTLRIMRDGKDADSIATFNFCHQVTPQQYQEQREAATLDSLQRLLRDISISSMPAKEKRRILKEFERHHPAVFLQHLASTF